MNSNLNKLIKLKQHEIRGFKLSIASSNDILEWSNGEVTKPETINYKTFKAEKKGLFDESIFGPSTDYRCPFCGTKYKKNDEGNFCEKTPECIQERSEILPKISKRSRMGHISLKAPIVHFWFLKIDHSIIAKLLGLKVDDKKSKEYTKKTLENIVYFKSHVVIDNGGIKSLAKNQIIHVQNAPLVYHTAFKDLIENKFKDPNSSEHKDILNYIKELEDLSQTKNAREYGIDFYDYNEILQEYAGVIIQSGAEAIETLLSKLDLKKSVLKIKKQINEILLAEKENGTIKESQVSKRRKLYKRLNIINGFIKSKQDPKDMILRNLPVMPADLRPLIQLDGGRHSTIDVNDLYRRIIIRNNRLEKWLELDAPVLIVQNEKRMLQEAIDALLDNKRKFNPIKGKDGRVLKSIADALDGKKGRFRQNLLGKRVDYSGRSVIVVGPELKLHQAGIPRIMAAKLFEPFIAQLLLKNEIVNSIKASKKLIEELNPIIWPHVEAAIKGKVVLLNRAPTLHRLSIQAFEPVLIRGKAIRLHPLVTTAFNADFDGDQMAIHIPISEEATLEARELMLANKNILGVKDGEPIINPTQDMILGLYYLTIEQPGAQGEGKFFDSIEDANKAYEAHELSLHARIVVKMSRINKWNLKTLSSDTEYKYCITTLGKLLLNNALPSKFPYIFDNTNETLTMAPSKYLVKYGENFFDRIASLPANKAFDKKIIAIIIKRLYDKYSEQITRQDLARVVKKLNTKTIQNLAAIFMEEPVFQELDSDHKLILMEIIQHRFAKINKEIAILNQGVERTLEIEERARILKDSWFDYTNLIAKSLDKIKQLGFKFSTISGNSISAFDISVSKIKQKLIDEAELFVQEVGNYCNVEGLITDDERYGLVKNRWEKVKEEIQEDLRKQIVDPKNIGNSIYMMMDSGARSNLSNFVQLAGMRGLMANNKVIRREEKNANVLVRNVIEVPVKSSFVEGLTGLEFFSSTHGARKGLTDVALNTANSGYLTRKLVDSAQDVVVNSIDCESDYGFEIKDIVDTKTSTVIIPLKERLFGRFLNNDVVDPQTQEVLYKRNQLISKEIAEKIIQRNIERVVIRSALGCHAKFGVCTKCYGVDLSNGKVVNIGEAVGIIAAQSIGEPGTQLTMRTFHTGGVASGEGVADVVSGFPRLKELVDATKIPWGKDANSGPIITEIKGIVKEIKEIPTGFTITIQSDNESKEDRVYKFGYNQKRRVKVGDKVNAAQKLVEGPIILERLLQVGGQRALQNYLLKEIQRLYRMQGITISDKYIEIIIRQMLSKSVVIDQGDTPLFNGVIVDVNDLHEINKKAISEGKKPAYVKPTIQGVNRVSLLSNSFLAAASYQETSKILVHAAIKGQIDVLRGLKENIIVGHQIPAGTGLKDIVYNSKYDIKSEIDLLK